MEAALSQQNHNLPPFELDFYSSSFYQNIFFVHMHSNPAPRGPSLQVGVLKLTALPLPYLARYEVCTNSASATNKARFAVPRGLSLASPIPPSRIHPALLLRTTNLHESTEGASMPRNCTAFDRSARKPPPNI